MSKRFRCREPVSWFAKQMEIKLRAMDFRGKRGWRSVPCKSLVDMLREEVFELRLLLHVGHNSLTAKECLNIIEECSDVANFAMMIADGMR